MTKKGVLEGTMKILEGIGREKSTRGCIYCGYGVSIITPRGPSFGVLCNHAINVPVVVDE